MKTRKRAEYGFGEYGFKHRAQWVFWGSLSSGERTQWVPFRLLFVCKRELTEFFAELTEFPDTAKLRIWTLRFRVFRAQDCLSRDKSSVGTRHAFFLSF